MHFFLRLELREGMAQGRLIDVRYLTALQIAETVFGVMLGTKQKENDLLTMVAFWHS